MSISRQAISRRRLTAEGCSSDMQTSLQQFLRVLRCAAPYRPRIILGVVSLILIAVLNAVSIGSLQPIFDGLFAAEGAGSGISLPDPITALLGQRLIRLQTFLQAHRISILTFIGGALFFVFVAKGALIYIQQLQLRYVAEGIQRDIRNDLYAHLHTLPLDFFVRRSTGEIMSRLNSDVEGLGEASTELFRNALREPFNIIGLIALLFLIKWQLALLSLLVLPVAILPIVKFGSKIRRRGTRVQEGRAELNTILQETISGVRIVKAFGMEEYERRRYGYASEQLFSAVMRIAKVDALTSPVLEVLGSVGIVVAIWVGGYLVFSKSLTPGAFMAFLGALASLYQPVKRISQINNNVQRGMAGVARVFELMDERPDVVEQPDAATLPRMQEGLQFDTVSFAYEPDRIVLRAVSCRAKLGEIVAIVGSSGAGKTTLVNLIPRFYDPTGGCIRIDGIDITRVTLPSLQI